MRLIGRTQNSPASLLFNLFECECLLRRPKMRLHCLLNLLLSKSLADKEEAIRIMTKYQREVECLLVYGVVPQVEGGKGRWLSAIDNQEELSALLSGREQCEMLTLVKKARRATVIMTARKLQAHKTAAIS